MFDLVNTDQEFSAASAAELKFMALFYNAVVVPDAFLMSYTPLFRHIDRLLHKSSDHNQDIISVFLEAGIIVPAIRSGDSLLKNWTGASPSITPGTALRVCKEEGRRVMEFVDRKASRYTKINLTPGTNRFGELLYEFMVGAEKPWRRTLSRASLQSHRVSRLLSDFEDLVQSELANKELRRLDIEQLISRYLIRHHSFSHRNGFLPKLYEQLNAAATNKPTDPGLLECQSLLNSSSTIYQAYHAHQFATLGGLFPLHDRGLIAAGLYHYLTGVPSKVIEHRRKYRVKRAPILFGSLDVSDLTLEQITEIRRTEEFREYVALLSTWKNPEDGQTGYDANPAFVDHLKDKYLPMIMKRYPHAGRIERTVKGVATGAHTLLELANQASGFEGLSVSDRFIIAGLKGAALALAHYSEEIAHSVHSVRIAHRKRRFLNQYWAPARAG